jgi:hypothetical protein
MTLDSLSDSAFSPDSDFGRICFGSRIMFMQRIWIGARILIPPPYSNSAPDSALRILAYVSTSQPTLLFGLTRLSSKFIII